MPFLSILEAFWVDFWWVLGLKLGAKLTKKSIIRPLVGNLPELIKKRSQAIQKSSKKLVSILIQFLMDLGTNLGRFWEGFGGQIGNKLAPNGKKTRPHNQSKR